MTYIGSSNAVIRTSTHPELTSLCPGDGKSATPSYIWRPRGHSAICRISRYFAVDPELHRRKSLAAGSRHGMETWIAGGPNRAAAPVTSFACSSQGFAGLETSD
ncbi:hypothetical protein TEQG_03924 [Trichophyton equinum CBS 127.97]|uniref:Uncharacterized protein n=1 Tax=Trichophyton equinum (strain ATCC MYA-4606 / CBS 127.97) TaxID=559882 RepID=F2PSH2_TRIEC|nr:hypothetical protein TEQG_03924 [Trichophyton equinum CBS 127.97]